MPSHTVTESQLRDMQIVGRNVLLRVISAQPFAPGDWVVTSSYGQWYVLEARQEEPDTYELLVTLQQNQLQ